MLWSHFHDYWKLQNIDDSHIVDDVPEKAPDSHLRQIFVTKNKRLCDAVKNKVYNFCAPYDYLNDHLKSEKDPIPLTLSDAQPRQYPLFLSSIDFLLLLDRTLSGESYFGTKDPNKFRIVNTDYGLLTCNTGTPIKTWVQITGKFFVKKIWPKMLQRCPLQCTSIHFLCRWKSSHSSKAQQKPFRRVDH